MPKKTINEIGLFHLSVKSSMSNPSTMRSPAVLSLGAIASGGPESALPLLFPSLIFRVFHSSTPGYVGAVGTVTLAYVATGILWPSLHGIVPSLGPGLLGNLMALPLMGSLMYLFSVTLVRLEERTRHAEGLVHDLEVEIAERQRAEQALGQSERRYVAVAVT